MKSPIGKVTKQDKQRKEHPCDNLGVPSWASFDGCGHSAFANAAEGWAQSWRTALQGDQIVAHDGVCVCWGLCVYHTLLVPTKMTQKALTWDVLILYECWELQGDVANWNVAGLQMVMPLYQFLSLSVSLFSPIFFFSLSDEDTCHWIQDPLG